jgi:hypothetical protein
LRDRRRCGHIVYVGLERRLTTSASCSRVQPGVVHGAMSPRSLTLGWCRSAVGCLLIAHCLAVWRGVEKQRGENVCCRSARTQGARASLHVMRLRKRNSAQEHFIISVHCQRELFDLPFLQQDFSTCPECVKFPYPLTGYASIGAFTGRDPSIDQKQPSSPILSTFFRYGCISLLLFNWPYRLVYQRSRDQRTLHQQSTMPASPAPSSILWRKEADGTIRNTFGLSPSRRDVPSMQ